MTWSYSGKPSESDLDKVRFLIGDTDVNEQFLQDEEIQFLIDEFKFVYTIAYQAARAILARISREYDQSVGSVKYTLSQRVSHYKDLINDLKVTSDSINARPYCGALSIDKKRVYEEETDRVVPVFTKDMHKVN